MATAHLGVGGDTAAHQIHVFHGLRSSGCFLAGLRRRSGNVASPLASSSVVRAVQTVCPDFFFEIFNVFNAEFFL